LATNETRSTGEFASKIASLLFKYTIDNTIITVRLPLKLHLGVSKGRIGRGQKLLLFGMGEKQNTISFPRIHH